jgi:chitin synthase
VTNRVYGWEHISNRTHHAFIRYLASINILSTYAFANTNDISWGTKGSDTVENDLGTVKGHGNEVEVELPAHQHDVDAAYGEALDNLRVKKPVAVVKAKSTSEEEQGRKDYYVSRREH